MHEKTRMVLSELRARRVYIIWAFVIIIVTTVTGIVSGVGPHISSSLGLTEGGTVAITAPHPQSRIFLDGDRVDIDPDEMQTPIRTTVSTGMHTVTAGLPGHHPWQKEFRVTANQTSVIKPFFVPQDAPRITLTQNDDRYAAVLRRIQRSRPPSRRDPLIARSGTVAITVSDSTIEAQWLGPDDEPPSFFCPSDECRDTITVTPIDEPIKNISFYKTRDDVVIFAAADGVYALELDPTGPIQNFQPLYTGDSPHFTKLTPNTIAVYDNGQLNIVSLSAQQ